MQRINEVADLVLTRIVPGLKASISKAATYSVRSTAVAKLPASLSVPRGNGARSVAVDAGSDYAVVYSFSASRSPHPAWTRLPQPIIAKYGRGERTLQGAPATESSHPTCSEHAIRVSENI
ncbi:hypothetical protein GJ744_008266 [Endocarpon pusillum]|uniref:Uncharacterized protein n=1 Tax=Endocarpon pusillum TaxID=364733 RepID=A0A8H7ALD1_9EURO|nr:hypothetical protein GJ744_008266 [Endocarpon pusillum]